FRGRPNFRYQKWGMNNAGFRGPDIAPTPAPGVTRVVIMGASESFGLYETEGAEYPARLQTLLDSVARGKFEVINAALPGLTLLSMEPYLRRVVLPLEPTLVMVYMSPSFYLEPTPPPLEYKPLPPAEPRMIRVAGLELEPGALDSRFGAKFRDVLKELVPSFVVAKIREWKLARKRAAHPGDWVWTSVPQERMELMRAHLRKLIETAQQNGVQLALVTHTNRFTSAPEDSAGPARRHLTNLASLYYPQATPRVLIMVDSAANQVMRDVAGEYGVTVIEAEGRIPSDSRHFADYAHFTDRGADVMARILATSILAPLSPSSDSKPGWTSSR
ncbi:MAG TPA: hypothetical protein VIL32_15675, partial [Steroidobacteraceae bacterium]